MDNFKIRAYASLYIASLPQFSPKEKVILCIKELSMPKPVPYAEWFLGGFISTYKTDMIIDFIKDEAEELIRSEFKADTDSRIIIDFIKKYAEGIFSEADIRRVFGSQDVLNLFTKPH